MPKRKLQQEDIIPYLPLDILESIFKFISKNEWISWYYLSKFWHHFIITELKKNNLTILMLYSKKYFKNIRKNISPNNNNLTKSLYFSAIPYNNYPTISFRLDIYWILKITPLRKLISLIQKDYPIINYYPIINQIGAKGINFYIMIKFRGIVKEVFIGKIPSTDYDNIIKIREHLKNNYGITTGLKSTIS